MVKEIVVVSGKGGTGKTSLTASLAALAGTASLADCDVDAADLHLLLAPEIRVRREFRAGREAAIRQDACTRCGECHALCRFEAVLRTGADGALRYRIDPLACEGCGVCVRFCPAGAIDFPERTSGEWFESQTRFGPLTHARLKPGAGNSGKLVTVVRREALRRAGEAGLELVLVDGPPGIGCPVIAALTGAALVVAVTEPTPSGEHDLLRVLELAAHFGLPCALWVNRWDLNPELGAAIERRAAERGARPVGRIPIDPAVTAAQLEGRPLVEAGGGPAARAIRDGWTRLERLIEEAPG